MKIALVLLSICLVASAAPQQRIIGGTAAEEGQFPYIVSITLDKLQHCAGFIYNDRWILTAASCVKDRYIVIIHLKIQFKDEAEFILDLCLSKCNWRNNHRWQTSSYRRRGVRNYDGHLWGRFRGQPRPASSRIRPAYPFKWFGPHRGNFKWW